MATAQTKDHPITLEPAPGRVRVLFNGTPVVASDRALIMRESVYPPVYYFPREDAEMSAFERTDHATYCPHKGDASYFTLAAGRERAQNAVWTYEDPKPGMAEIKDRLAFYPRHVTIEADG
jgi:uncharacterized protein (DUF427 family)